MRKTVRTLLVLIPLLAISVGSVFASWLYPEDPILPADAVIRIGFSDWSGADILPDDNEAGENHLSLIEMILNGKIQDSNGSVISLGLNDPNSYISKEIDDRSDGWISRSDTLGSMDYWERNDINKYFDTTNAQISFVLYFPEGVSDTYYLYTTSVQLKTDSGDPMIAIGQTIYPIYRTVLQKNGFGEYVAKETKLGYATSAWYDNRYTGSWLRYPSFSPSSWTEGTMGYDMASAIWTYKGISDTASVTHQSTEIYYRISCTQNEGYTVTTEPYTSVRVVDGTGTEVAVTAGAQGSSSLTFAAPNTEVYYIILYGASTIDFEIS